MRHKYFFAAGLMLIMVTLADCGGKSVLTYPTAEEQFARAKQEYDSENYFKAIEQFQRVIFNFPGASVVDTAQYYLALSYFGNEDYELAAVEFRRLANNYPQSDFVDEAQYMSGVCFLKNSPGHYGLDQEDMKRGIQVLNDFLIDNPDSPLIEDARQSVLEGMTKLARKEYENGMLYYKIYDYKAASIYFQFVIDNYTDTKYAAYALFKLSEIAFKREQYTEAMDKFKSFMTIYPSNELTPKAQEYIDEISRRLETVNASGES